MSEKSIYSKPILTTEFRLCFPALFSPKTFKVSDKPKFMMQMLFKPNDPFLAKLKAEALIVLKEKFKDIKSFQNLTSWPTQLPVGFWNPFRVADETPSMEKYTSHAGHIVISAKSALQPIVIDQNKQEILDEKQIYSGCYCRALVTVSAYKSKEGGAGITIYFSSVQKLRDGEPLSGLDKEKEMSAFDVVPMDNEIYN